MSKILLSGYYGFSNAGDEAMLTAIVDVLAKAVTKKNITVITGNPKSTSFRHNVTSIHRFNLFKIIKAMRSSKLLVSGGGSLLQDVTSKKSLYYYLTILFLAKLLGKKVMLYAQGIGPINSTFGRKLTGIICKKVDLITVRDDGSYEELQRLGIKKENIIVTSDAVFALGKTPESFGDSVLKKYGIRKDKKIIGISVRNWENPQRFIREFAIAAEKLKAEHQAQIVFIPMQFPEDAKISEKVIELMSDKNDVFLLKSDFTTNEYLAIISQMNLVIAMRLHALVFAALCGVKFLGVSYDPKIDRFLNSFDGVSIAKIEDIKAKNITEAVCKHINDDLKEQNNKIEKLRLEAHVNAQRAINLVK